MKKVFGTLVLVLACAVAVTHGDAQDKDKDKKPIVGALAPHKLDGAFEKAKKPGDITNALLNDALFQQAVKNAFKAKQDREAEMKQKPNVLAATPAQAARVAFLTTLLNEPKQGDKQEEKKP